MTIRGKKVRVVRLAIGVVALILVVECCLNFFPPFLALGYALLGKSPECSILQTFSAARLTFRYKQVTKEYAETSEFRLLETDGPYSHWTTPHGGYWIPKGSDSVLPVLFAQQQVDIYGVNSVSFRPDAVVLDCGAHIGLFTRKALDAGARKVIAIEPGPENLECLRRNLKEDIARGAVVVYPKGVWDSESTLTFHMFSGTVPPIRLSPQTRERRKR